MKIRAYSLFPMAVLALLAGLTFWLQRAIQIEEGQRSVRGRHDVDYAVEGFSVRKLDPQGNLLYMLAGTRMLHYGDEEDTEVVAPRLTYFGKPPPLHLSAESATINKDRTVVDLRRNVRVVREPTPKDAEMVLTTSQMTVYPEQEVASTREPVRLVQGPSVLTGVGMDLDNKVRTLRLHEQVRGTFHKQR